MSDNVLSLLAAKVKAVGLVAGTAMVTTALVGGGAVAMTTVSDQSSRAAVTQAEVLETSSDTPTVGIEAPKPRVTGAPMVCDDSENHGQNMKAYVATLDKGPGRGALVSAAAQSDCGKKAGTEAEETEVEVEKTDEQKAEEKAAREATKAAREAARDQAKADRKAAKDARKAEKAGKNKD